MKREFLTHLLFGLSVIILATLLRGFFSLIYWPFWLGGLVGIFLPDLDHLVYIYFLKPQEYISQRAGYMMNKQGILSAFRFLSETRNQRTELVFHTALFQAIFFVLTFWIMTSSGSLFGKGLVLAFATHLYIDSIIDFMELGDINNWFKSLSLSLNRKQTKIYLIASGVFLALCALVF